MALKGRAHFSFSFIGLLISQLKLLPIIPSGVHARVIDVRVRGTSHGVRWRKRLFQYAKLGCILALLLPLELTHPSSARGLNPDVQITQYAHDGVGKEDEAYLWFYVQPAFYQRFWFKILLGVLGLVALWLFYLYRVHKATESVSLRLMERLAERERIARDLHDTFFQGIQGLLLRFNTGTNQLPPDATARPIFVAALEQSDQVMLEGRKLVFHLRETNESAFLEDALAQAGEELRTQHAVPFKLTVLGTQHNLQPEASRELYSLGREALYNAFRHASATLIVLELHYSVQGIVLKVRDDGHGISKDVLRDKKRAGHWGLPGMYERAEKLGGRLSLWGGAGSGTEIEVSVPADTVYREELKSLVPGWVSRWLRRWKSMPS